MGVKILPLTYRCSVSHATARKRVSTDCEKQHSFPKKRSHNTMPTRRQARCSLNILDAIHKFHILYDIHTFHSVTFVTMCQMLAHLTLLNMTLWMCPDDMNLAVTPSPLLPSPSSDEAPAPSLPAPSSYEAPSLPAPSSYEAPSLPPSLSPTPLSPLPPNTPKTVFLTSPKNTTQNNTAHLPLQTQNDLAWLHFLWCIPLVLLCVILYHRRRTGSSSRILRLWAPKERDVARIRSAPVQGSEKVDDTVVRSVSQIQVVL